MSDQPVDSQVGSHPGYEVFLHSSLVVPEDLAAVTKHQQGAVVRLIVLGFIFLLHLLKYYFNKYLNITDWSGSITVGYLQSVDLPDSPHLAY